MLKPDDERKLNQFVQKRFEKRKDCPSPLLHVDIAMDLELLHELHMQWYFAIQGSGDVVYTNPAVSFAFTLRITYLYF